MWIIVRAWGSADARAEDGNILWAIKSTDDVGISKELDGI